MSIDIRHPEDPKMAREEIERTRQRMSETLDQIEDVILSKKEELEEKKADLRRKLDVGAQVRAEPIAAAAIVLGIGVLVGFFTGGTSRKAVRSARRRSRKWEKRAHRLLDIARSQEEQLAALQREQEAITAAYVYGSEPEIDDEFDDLPDEELYYRDALRGEEIYPLDPDFDDETIEYPPASARRKGSFRDRLGAIAADAVESLLDAVPSRR